MSDFNQGQLHFISDDEKPILEIQEPSGEITQRPFEPHEQEGESSWRAGSNLTKERGWVFRICLTDGRYIEPGIDQFFRTPAKNIWVQNDQLFCYKPTAEVSVSRVIRINEFEGRLSTRALYIYLPRGYDDHPDKTYPVLYMHDGQNVFQAFVDDSYAGSWQADWVADRLINNGELPECIIVGVSHGGEGRLQEYLPPNCKLPIRYRKVKWFQGRAKKTAKYYMKDVASYIQKNYRVKTGRENTATCGSSMGGLFSLYLAWYHPKFAKNHAAMSPSIWTTVNKDGKYEILEKLKETSPPDIRLWIDSGTLGSNGQGDDGQVETVLASEILLKNGFIDGRNLQHYLDRGADHSEAAWSGRFHKVLKYLFPLEDHV